MATPTTTELATPGHETVAMDGKESVGIGLDLLHILQLMLHSTTVTPVASITPGAGQIHHCEWLQKLCEWLGSAAHSSAEPAQHY